MEDAQPGEVHMEESVEVSAFDALPQEIVDQIIAYLFPSKNNQGHLLQVCWSFYYASIAHIYSSPHLSSKNLLRFSETISSRQSAKLGELVKILNLRHVIHGAKASQMSRVVRRCSTHLEEFYAPQVGFQQSAFRAIGLCSRIKVLDLNAVSEKVELSYFLSAIAKAETLETINFPRFSKNTDGPLEVQWPPNLKHLWLSGAVDDDLLAHEMPKSVDTIIVQNCPTITLEGLLELLGRLGSQLRSFTALYPLPLPANSLDLLFVLCPALQYFKGYVDYFTQELFRTIPDNHPLDTLVLDSAGGLLDRGNKITADDVSLAIVEGRLSNLRRVRWSLQVGWRSEKSDVRDLGDLLADANGDVLPQG